MRSFRAGFTVMELMLVIAVMVLLAAITVPSINTMYSDVPMDGSADLVRARWADARGRAAEDGIAYRFAVKPQTGMFRVAPDAGEFWGGTNGGGPAPELDAPPLDVEGELPKGVVFADGEGGEGGGEWVTLVTFLPDGTAKENVEVTFKGQGARPLVLRLRGLTGAVTVSRLAAGS